MPSASASSVVNVRLDHLGRHLHHPLALGTDDEVEERRVHLGLVEADAGLGRDHPRLAGQQPDLGVDRRRAVARHQPGELLGQRLGPQLRHQLAVVGHQPQGPRVLPRLERDRRVAEPERHRRRTWPARRTRRAPARRRPRRCRERSRSAAARRWRRPRRGTPPRGPSRAAVGVELGAHDRIGDPDALGLEPDRPLDGSVATSSSSSARYAASTSSSTVDDRRDLVAAGRVVPQPRGVPAPRAPASATGRRSRPRGRPPRARPRVVGRPPLTRWPVGPAPSSSSSRAAASSSLSPPTATPATVVPRGTLSPATR